MTNSVPAHQHAGAVDNTRLCFYESALSGTGFRTIEDKNPHYQVQKSALSGTKSFPEKHINSLILLAFLHFGPTVLKRFSISYITVFRLDGRRNFNYN